jgi:UDP-GlcNAc:undecaprenyl-phosphate/decaprenyl-phosphate GlcNAc-1-phosphate transferase
LAPVLEVGIFLAGAAISAAIVYAIRRFAGRLRLVDTPNQRSMHREPMPRGGGAAIVVGCGLGLAAAAALGLRPELPAYGGFLAGALLLAVVGLGDDIRSLSFAPRLAAQFVAAALLIAGLALPGAGQAGPFGLGSIGWLLAIAALLWTVGFSNAYNFMDGIDGLAATYGIVAGLGWALLASVGNQPWLALLALLVAAGCAGFLVFNWPPASIFMGDVGSVVLGFTFTFLMLAAARGAPALAVAGILLQWPFVFDTAFTMLRRLMRGENLVSAHRTHLYQRLVLAGWRPATVVTLYAGLTLVALVLGVISSRMPGAAAQIAPLVLLLPLAFGLWWLVIRAERAKR